MSNDKVSQLLKSNRPDQPVGAEGQPTFCQFCPHAAHGTERCSRCHCKGKARWWQKLFGGLGEAIGEAKFDD